MISEKSEMNRQQYVTMSLRTSRICLGSPFKLTITIDKMIGFSLDGCYLECSPSEHFSSDRVYTDSTKTLYSLKLNPLNGASIFNIPDSFTVSLFYNSGKIISCQHWAVPLRDFMGKLFSGSQQDYNILLFGLTGSGKSSFINSVASLLCTDGIPIKYVISGGSSGHVTKTFSYSNVCVVTRNGGEFLEQEITPFLLWDTWGLDRNNYQRNDFSLILSGSLPEDFQMANEIKYGDGGFSVKDQNRQHCVLFFTTAADLQAESEFLKSTKKYVEEATLMEVQSIIVISHADTVVDDAQKNSSFLDLRDPKSKLPLYPPILMQLITKAANYFKVEENCIFPLINYKNEATTNMRIDKYVALILDKACNLASLTKLRRQNSIGKKRNNK